MTETRRSVPLLAGISILAIGLAASPIAIDLSSMSIGANAALAQGGQEAPGAAPGAGDQGARQGMEMQQGPRSQSGMTQQMQAQTMSRETVRSVQRKLNQLGYHAGPEDGIMGPRTRKAISAYQARTGMKANGVLTPDLADRIMAASKGA